MGEASMTFGANMIRTNRICQHRWSNCFGDQATQQMRCRRKHSESSVARSLNGFGEIQEAECSFNVCWLHGFNERSRSLLGVPALPTGCHRRSDRPKNLHAQPAQEGDEADCNEERGRRRNRRARVATLPAQQPRGCQVDRWRNGRDALNCSEITRLPWRDRDTATATARRQAARR